MSRIVPPFGGYEQRIEKVTMDAVRAMGLGLNMPVDSVPLFNDDTYHAEVESLIARAPAHFEDRIRSFAREAPRAYARVVFREIKGEAERIERVLASSADLDRKLAASTRAQDLAGLAMKLYGRTAAYTSSRDGNFDEIMEVAKAGRSYALSRLTLHGNTDVEAAQDSGQIARAVLGTHTADTLRAALAAGDFTVPAFPGISRYAGLVLNESEEPGLFKPPVLVGWTYPALDERGATPRAVARAIVYAVLASPTGNNIVRDSDDATTKRIKEGRITFDQNNGNMTQNGKPALLLTIPAASHYGRPTVHYVVPLGNFIVQHVRRDEIGAQAMEDYLRMLLRAGYHYAPASASREHMGIGKTKSGEIKWISPDPFARKR